MSFPEALVRRPMVYEIVKRFDVVPNIRRANVEDDTRLDDHGARRRRRMRVEQAIAWLREQGCIVDDMSGDIVAG